MKTPLRLELVGDLLELVGDLPGDLVPLDSNDVMLV